jgi:drug/metabolite transporter (DMT)-like permease
MSVEPTRRSDRFAALPVETRAIAFMALAALMSSGLHVGVRTMSDRGLPSIEIVFLRTLLTLLLTLPFVLRSGKGAWRTTVPGRQIVRGILGTLSMWAWYHALSNMRLADAATLGQTTSLFLVLGATLWFREKLTKVRLGALVLGFAGAVVMLKPGVGLIDPMALLALLSSLLWATSLLMAKEMTRFDATMTITFYQPLMIMPPALMLTIPVWVTPNAGDMAILTVMSAAAAVSNYCMVRALGMADAAVTAPIDYTKLLWTATAAYVLFAEVPTAQTWIGGALIVAGSLWLALSERRRR